MSLGHFPSGFIKDLNHLSMLFGRPPSASSECNTTGGRGRTSVKCCESWKRETEAHRALGGAPHPLWGQERPPREKCVKLHWGEMMSGQHTEEVMREGKPRNIPGSGDSTRRHGGQSPAAVRGSRREASQPAVRAEGAGDPARLSALRGSSWPLPGGQSGAPRALIRAVMRSVCILKHSCWFSVQCTGAGTEGR